MAYIEDTNLIEEIKSLKISVGGKDVFPDEAKESVLRVISEQPTADVVKVKHGEWKLHPDGSGTCSCCNRTQKFVWDYDNAQNFCGHCGAKMSEISTGSKRSEDNDN